MRTGNARGQAMVELAILGTVAVLALSLLIRVGLTGNFNQEIMMATFRKAVLEAGSDNTPTDEADGTRQQYNQAREVTYHQFRARQMADPSTGFGLMLRQVTGSNAHVTWSDALTYASEDGNGVLQALDGRSRPHQKTVVEADRDRKTYWGHWGSGQFVSDFNQQSERTRTTTQNSGNTQTVGTGSDYFSVHLGPTSASNIGQPQTITHDF